MQHLTIAYMTNRKEPHIDWFFDSLHRELGGNYEGISIVIVDFYHPNAFQKWKSPEESKVLGFTITSTLPKPNVWQGEHRLTKENYFAASNARNTAICYAYGSWICFVDDLSVLLPGWFKCVKEAMEQNYIALGAYKKVKNLVVENGEVKSFTEHPAGNDPRVGNLECAIPCQPNWLFGCSLVAPVEAFLEINGWPEAACDGMGYEDCVSGIALSKHGYQFRYDRRMMTYESEEHHYIEKPFIRSDPGVSPNDKSHAMLRMLENAKWFDNDFGMPTLRDLRAHVLNGGEFPVRLNPQHEWFTKRLLSEL